MLVSCATHAVFDPSCRWCATATEVTRKVLWRRRWRDVKEIIGRLLR